MKSVFLRVVGTSFECRQSLLKSFFEDYRVGGKYPVTLKREEGNKFDPNAVSVWVDGVGKIGYIGSKNGDNVRLLKCFDLIKAASVGSIGYSHEGLLGLSIRIDFNDDSVSETS